MTVPEFKSSIIILPWVDKCDAVVTNSSIFMIDLQTRFMLFNTLCLSTALTNLADLPQIEFGSIS